RTAPPSAVSTVPVSTRSPSGPNTRTLSSTVSTGSSKTSSTASGTASTTESPLGVVAISVAWAPAGAAATARAAATTRRPASTRPAHRMRDTTGVTSPRLGERAGLRAGGAGPQDDDREVVEVAGGQAGEVGPDHPLGRLAEARADGHVPVGAPGGDERGAQRRGREAVGREHGDLGVARHGGHHLAGVAAVGRRDDRVVPGVAEAGEGDGHR